MKYQSIVACFIIYVLHVQATFAQPDSVVIGNTTLDVRIVIQGDNEMNGIDIPWEIHWGPDDHIWMTERYGRVSRLNPETGERFTILDLSGVVFSQNETGLLGLTLHPDFQNSPQVFIAYTYEENGVKERIARYDYNAATEVLENPFILLDGIDGYLTHVGCRLMILPDTTLLLTTGDAQLLEAAQDPDALTGKTLRMNLDGTIPIDNPFGPSSYAYSLGHRNAQGLLLAPNGMIYSSEHGPSSNDELNIIVPGGNYGWPEVEGFCDLSSEMQWCDTVSNYQDPVANWYETSTLAVSDIAWYHHPAIPEWQGRILLAVLKKEHLRSIELDVSGTSVIDDDIHLNPDLENDPGSTDPSVYSNGLFDRLRDVCVSPDGRVFLATSGPSWGTSGTFENSIVELKNSSYIPNSTVFEEFKKVNVYPNPTTDLFSVSGLDSKLISISVYSAEGKELLRNMSSDGKFYDIAGLSPGLYLVCIRTSKGERFLKLQKL